MRKTEAKLISFAADCASMDEELRKRRIREIADGVKLALAELGITLKADSNNDEGK